MKKIVIVFICMATVGCANPFGDAPSKVDSSYGPEDRIMSPANVEPVSGALTRQSSVLHRKPEISVGSSTDKIKLTTTSNRTVFLSVQGQIISQ